MDAIYARLLPSSADIFIANNPQLLKFKWTTCVYAHPLEKHHTITRIPSLRVFISTNVPLDMYTDIGWCKEAHRLRWAFLYVCRFTLKFQLWTLFCRNTRPGSQVEFLPGRAEEKCASSNWKTLYYPQAPM